MRALKYLLIAVAVVALIAAAADIDLSSYELVPSTDRQNSVAAPNNANRGIDKPDTRTGKSHVNDEEQVQRRSEAQSRVKSLARESSYLSNLVLVNKSHELPAGFVPGDLVVPDVRFAFSEDLPKKQMRQEAAQALELLFQKAEEDGIDLAAVSGFRSYDRQAAIFASAAQRVGEVEANRVSARPGQSEHQTGLAMDVSSASVGYQLVESFGEMPEGQWLAANAPAYGFIIRYPAGKESITGYRYEPWHIRYVGVEHATRISQREITLEEYLGT